MKPPVLSVALLSLLCCCQHVPPAPAEAPAAPGDAAVLPADSTRISFPGADRIEVTFAPHADFEAANVRRTAVTDPAAIAAWLQELAELPRKGVLFITFADGTREYRVEFWAKGERLGSLRIKGEFLDAPASEGWDFYAGQDRAFVKLVERLFAG